MTWRGRVSLGDDLRRLHESARASDMSREIGYSSVTEGEGSLDLLTESGDVRAAFGDQPDGRFGVSIWHGGSLRFIPDLMQELQDEDESLSGRISGLGDRMVSAEGTLSSHSSRITEASNAAAAADSRAANARQRADDAFDLAAGRATTASVAAVDAKAVNARQRADDAYDFAITVRDRANDAYSRAGTGIANAATAQARADAAYALAEGAATPGDVNNQVQALRSEVHHWMQTARASNPSLPPPIPK